MLEVAVWPGHVWQPLLLRTLPDQSDRAAPRVCPWLPVVNAHSLEGATFETGCPGVCGSAGNVVLLHVCRATGEASECAGNDYFDSKSSAHSRRGALTQRELEILSLLAEGNTTSEIASLMRISQAAVRNHVQHLLEKLHVRNRLEAIVMGQRLELI